MTAPTKQNHLDAATAGIASLQCHLVDAWVHLVGWSAPEVVLARDKIDIALDEMSTILAALAMAGGNKAPFP